MILVLRPSMFIETKNPATNSDVGSFPPPRVMMMSMIHFRLKLLADGGRFGQSCRSESPRFSRHVAAAFVPETKVEVSLDAPAGCATAVRVGTAVVVPAERRSAQAWEEICPQRKSLASKWARANSHLTASRRAAGDVRPRFKPAGFACAV